MPTRGAKISPRIRALIRLRALEEPRLPRDVAAMHLIDEIRHMGLIAPTEDTLMKMISRERNREPDPLDGPWSLGVCKEHKDGFRPEIIPRLIELQKFLMRDDWEGPKVLTVRQAQWVARLHDLVKEICITRYPDSEYLWIVWVVADMYATWGQMQEIVGEKSDTSNLDKEFFIAQTFWGLPIEKWATRYAALQALYDGIKQEYRHDHTKRNRNDDDFSSGGTE